MSNRSKHCRRDLCYQYRCKWVGSFSLFFFCIDRNNANNVAVFFLPQVYPSTRDSISFLLFRCKQLFCLLLFSLLLSVVCFCLHGETFPSSRLPPKFYIFTSLKPRKYLLLVIRSGRSQFFFRARSTKGR